ncbi:MAG: HAD family hydrolase [Lactobacillaceae bacterium]|jgi:HAD superfamily hydrolase (TIGR01549 family)|nr:HAD family hydrolase [Lactobacillaceae bacterium]
MTYKNIVFDYDGTLADTSDLIVTSVQEAFEAQNFDLPTAENIKQYIGEPITEFFPKLAPRELTELELTTMTNSYRKAYKHDESPETIKLFPGIADLLTELVAQDYKLFMLTSKNSDVARRNADVLGITDKFTKIVGSDMVAKPKPDPAGLLKIMHDNDLVPAETLMVGDATFDIDMAFAARVRSVGVTWGTQDIRTLEEAKPTYIANDINELADNIFA